MLGFTVTYPRTLSQREVFLLMAFAINLILFQSNVRSSSIFDYLVLSLSSLRPFYLGQIFPGMSPRSSAVSISDDLKPTVFKGGETVYRPIENLHIFLSRETVCLSFYANTCTHCCRTSFS